MHRPVGRIVRRVNILFVGGFEERFDMRNQERLQERRGCTTRGNERLAHADESFDLKVVHKEYLYSPKYVTVSPGELRMAMWTLPSGHLQPTDRRCCFLHGEPMGLPLSKMIPLLVEGGRRRCARSHRVWPVRSCRSGPTTSTSFTLHGSLVRSGAPACGGAGGPLRQDWGGCSLRLSHLSREVRRRLHRTRCCQTEV